MTQIIEPESGRYIMKWRVPVTRITKSTVTVEVDAKEALLAERAAVELAKKMEFPVETEMFEPGIAEDLEGE
jgi:hypothetical protein